MARKAFVSSDMAHDEALFDVSQENPTSALLWPWIVTYFDDWGRALRSPKRIKSQLFPNIPTVTVDMIDEALELFNKYGLIECYSDGQHEYMAIPMAKWFKWQTHIRSEKREKDNSKYPPCPTDSAQVREGDNEVRADARECSQARADHDPSPSLSLSPSKDSEVVVDAHARDVEREINLHYQKTYGRFPNEVQVSRLSQFTDKGMQIELVFQAMDKARSKGKDLGYALGVLERQYDRGIRTVAQAEIDDAQRQTAVGGVRDGPNKEPGGTIRGLGKNKSVTGGQVGRIRPER